jgi:hypothetical protein
MKEIRLLDRNNLLYEDDFCCVKFAVEMIVDGFVVYKNSAELISGSMPDVAIVIKNVVDWLKNDFSSIEVDNHKTPDRVDISQILRSFDDIKRS